MASISAVRAAIAHTIDVYSKMEIYCYPEIRDNGHLPCVMMEPVTADFLMTNARGMDEWNLNLFVLTSRSVGTDDAQDTLDELCTGSGPNSIRQIIYDHSDVGLNDGTNVTVAKLFGYGGSFEWAKTSHVGAILHLVVRTPS
jgi:hypothetical protein